MSKKSLVGTSDGEIMTIREVADFLRLSEATIYRLAQAGKIPAMKIGRTWRFQKHSIEEWMRQQGVERMHSPDA